MRSRREWFLLGVVIVLVIVVLAIFLYGRGYQPFSSIIQGGNTPPAAPTDLSGQAVSYSQITIHWVDNSKNEDGFRIYRNGALIGSVGPGIATFQDNDLKYATVYSYLVAAYNEYGETQCLTATSIKTLNPPITMTLNKIGVLFDHDPFIKGAGEIYVYVGVTDGKSEPELIRVPSSGTISLNDNESKEVDQKLFVKDSVGDELRIVAIAFESDDPAVAQLVNLLTDTFLSYLLGDYSGAVSSLVTLLQSQPSAGEDNYQQMAESTDDDFVGAVEQTWTAGENWGIGSHADVRNGDFRLWFTISAS
jgi:hypothetical protein